MTMKISEAISNKFRNMSILCAFLVTVIHCRPDFAEGSGAWWLKQMLENGICMIAVPFFFAASGFFIAGHIHDYGWYGREVRKRIWSLAVPYLVWSTLYLGFVLVKGLTAGHWYGDQYLAPRALAAFYGINIGDVTGLTPLWYVRGLLILVVVSPVLVKLLELGVYALGFLFVVYGVVCPGPNGGGTLHEVTRCGLIPMAGFFYFTLGMAIRDGRVTVNFETRSYKHFASLCIGLALMAVQAYASVRHNSSAQYFGWLSIPCALYGVFGIMSDRKWPSWLTVCSFPVFLIHKFLYKPASLLFGGCQTVSSYLSTAAFVFVGAAIQAWIVGL